MNANDDLGVAQSDHVAVGQLPFLDGGVVDRGAVGRVQVRQQRDRSVPPDLEVATRHTGVGEAELGVLAATDHVGAFAQLVGAAAAVVELQRDRRTGRAAAVAGAAVPLLAVSGLAVGRGRAVALVAVALLGLLAVVVAGGLAAVLLAAVATAVAALVGVTTLIRVAALVGVSTLIRVAGPRFGAAVVFVARRGSRGRP